MLENDFYGIAEALTGPNGFAKQLKEVVGNYTRMGNGMLNVREQALRGKIKRLDDEIANKERRLEQRQTALTQQFSRLESSLSAMQRQSQYLSAALPGSGGNMISQLLG